MQKNKVMLQEMDTGLAPEEALLGQIDILIKHYIFWDVWVILCSSYFSKSPYSPSPAPGPLYFIAPPLKAPYPGEARVAGGAVLREERPRMTPPL